MSGALSLGCVLMASGFGSRFGSNKLLAEAGGVPLVRRALELYRGLPFARRAIVSQYDEILILGERMGYEPIPNREAAQGISASVRLGTAALSAMDGLLFGVCDQPWLRPETVLGLLEIFRAHPEDICSLSCQGTRGSPALFPAAFFPELSALTGDTGGGQVIRRHPDRLRLVEVPDPRELSDIDRPEDLRG